MKTLSFLIRLALSIALLGMIVYTIWTFKWFILLGCFFFTVGAIAHNKVHQKRHGKDSLVYEWIFKKA